MTICGHQRDVEIDGGGHCELGVVGREFSHLHTVEDLLLALFRGILGEAMADELLSVLTRFHREVVVPDIERIVDSRVVPLRDEMLSNFDAVYRRFDRLESEYESLTAAVKRLEG